MHAGARILRVTCSGRSVGERCPGSWSIEVLARFKEHESMNYASDIWIGGQTMDQENEEVEKSSLVCVSSSFYDRRLCVWRTDV
jgi:diphthamide biosynthesis protein 7